MLFLNSHGAILCLDRAEFLFLSFGCMMFFNFGVGCFVFSRANLGLRCSPAGERTEGRGIQICFFEICYVCFWVCPGAKTMISIMF